MRTRKPFAAARRAKKGPCGETPETAGRSPRIGGSSGGFLEAVRAAMGFGGAPPSTRV